MPLVLWRPRRQSWSAYAAPDAGRSEFTGPLNKQPWRFVGRSHSQEPKQGMPIFGFKHGSGFQALGSGVSGSRIGTPQAL